MAWPIFRQPDGRAWHPSSVTDRFQRDYAAAGLSPIRLHDGRHSAATYMKAAGADLLDMRKKLGHASVTVTADIYPASLDEIDRMIAERTAALTPPATDRPVRGPTRTPPGRTVPEQSHRPPIPLNGQKTRSRRRRMRDYLRIP
ncbi:tyrosine-type recombinase/integrase [Plantactinospora sp. S1510]|uniref:Tyrosine-type recombinase/integrase n=1 Tax=Plantactinospora alkalitolerans TaxID=2789879 RepID=A0ABS0H0P2_9ACTN|nr:tyrosine-type recombinase/integrase [Plantactinospora alkalitolerans]MBF9132035.1 tyrosine-type recombinase/integrase [Plantactinospora alkalitolerans]